MSRKKSEIESPPNVKKTREKRGNKTENFSVLTNEEKPHCHIHDKAGKTPTNIRENVCVNESDYPLTRHTDGKDYCLFHLPTKDKNIAKFEEIFQERLDSVKVKLAQTEELPEAEREELKHKISYNFAYVWFPSEVILSNYQFQTRT